MRMENDFPAHSVVFTMVKPTAKMSVWLFCPAKSASSAKSDVSILVAAPLCIAHLSTLSLNRDHTESISGRYAVIKG